MIAIRSNRKTPMISVLMPVFNSERYIGAAVESVLAQTYDDFELLALDGGSSDRSLSILRKFEMSDARIRAISRKNLALVPSLNEMIAEAQGRYLARMDSDDICRPERFEKQVAYLDAHPECVAVGSRVLFIDPEGMPICEAINELTHNEIDSANMSGATAMRICHPSVMMRKETVVQVGLYSEEFLFAEDFDLFLRIAEVGKLANLPEVLLEYRQHLGSVCHSRSDESRLFGTRAVKDAWKRRGMVVSPNISEPPLKAESSAETHCKWAWWALSAGNLATARSHAIKAFVANPINIEYLKAVACAMRGY